MRLHPYPVNDPAPAARQAVLWKTGGGSSLMIDTPAVPLRFNADLFDDADDVMPIPASDAASLQVSYADALIRIRSLEAQLLCCRELGAR